MAEQNVAEVDVPAQFTSEDFDGGNDFSGDDGGAEGAEGAGQPAPGTGQSKSSRRRRRKRKNKVVAGSGSGAEGSAPAASDEGGSAAPFVMEGESLALAASAAPARRANPSQPQAGSGGQQPQAGSGGQQPQGQAQPQGQGQGGKRWKKKFRDRERRQRPDSPGTEARADSNGGGAPAPAYGGGDNGYRRDGRPDNFGNLAGGFKRKGKSGGSGSNGGGQGQRKDRGFVGPMDHSYREAEGSLAPPSTIQLHGSHGRGRGHRHQGDNQPIDRSMPPAIPIPENAQTHIYFFVEDLFITAKVQETARKQGIKVAFVKNDKEALAELTKGDDMNRPALIVFDLNNLNAKPLTLIPKLKAKLKRSASIIGFLSSIQGDLKAKAVEAGCDSVMPRAAFSQNLPNLLRRYGVEEAEEVNFNF